MDVEPAPRRRAAEPGLEVSSLERDHPVSYAIFAMARVQRAVAATRLAEAGLFVNQDLMILLLGDHDGLPQQVLARTLRISHVTVAKMVARLERSGLVAREPSPVDRRVNLVRLTDDGRDLREHITAVWDDLEHTAASRLSPRQQRAFLDAVDVIRASIDASSSPDDVQPA